MNSPLPAQTERSAFAAQAGRAPLASSGIQPLHNDTASAAKTPPAANRAISSLQRFARNAIFARLQRLRTGSVEIVEGDERRRFGDAAASSDAPAMTVHDARMFPRAAFGGTTGVAESYMDGDWSCTDLTALIRVFIQNLDTMVRLDSGLARAAEPLRRFGHWLRRNTPRGSRRNIAAHYDLSTDFFALFLDETLMYSCAHFEREDATLAEGSSAKNERLCRMLRLAPGDHLLEIGAGWGGFAIHAAGKHGCRVTTTTISEKQFAFAKQRIEKLGLSDKITVMLKDYRAVEGQFDKLASIEMIEAVGHDYLDIYFKRCGELLKPRGAMALQAITIQDRFFDRHARSVDFIKKHIFPGSCLPSVARMLESTRKFTDLNLARLDEITPHYVKTLRAWRERFMENIGVIRKMGFGEKFIRMWEYYLCYCEAGFAERHIGAVQMLLAKPGWRIETV